MNSCRKKKHANQTRKPIEACLQSRLAPCDTYFELSTNLLGISYTCDLCSDLVQMHARLPSNPRILSRIQAPPPRCWCGSATPPPLLPLLVSWRPRSWSLKRDTLLQRTTWVVGGTTCNRRSFSTPFPTMQPPSFPPTMLAAS